MYTFETVYKFNIIMYKIAFLEPHTLSNAQRQTLTDMGAFFYQNYPMDEKDLINRLESAEIIITNDTLINEGIYSQLRFKPKIIKSAIDVAQLNPIDATKYEIKIQNCPSWNRSAVVELTVALLLNLFRQVIRANQTLRESQWLQSSFTGCEIKNKNILLVGYGGIGKELKRILTAFGAKVDYLNSKSHPQDWQNKIPQTDVLIVCCSLNSSTQSIINKNILNQMKKTSILINVSRGAVINQNDLLDALTTKQIAGAGIDVFCDEPKNGQKPNEQITKIANLPNVLALPHIAYNTIEARQTRFQEIVQNIESNWNSQPTNLIN
jgi:glycerate dehydrogenase